jgi:Ca-activated chloride channel family protein
MSSSERMLIHAILLLLCATAAWAQTDASGDQPPIKVDVKLVNVFVTVTDDRGAPVSSLKKEDFQIAEDGNSQKISVFDRESELPLSIVLLVDTSLSTRKDLKLEVESARRFARSILRPIDALSVYQFSELVEQLSGFTADLHRIDRALDRIHVGSATAMYDAVYLGAQSLDQRQGRKVMVVITDGGDTVSRVNYQGALRAAQEAEAILYSIIVVPIEANAGRDLGGEHALIQLSHDTGGKHYYATDLTKLDKVFGQIGDELRTQYLLAYYPSRRSTASDFRRIEVRVNTSSDARDIKVRHRAGYFTHKSY